MVPFYKEIPETTQIPHGQQEEDTDDRDIRHEHNQNPHDDLSEQREQNEPPQPLEKSYPSRVKRHPDYWKKY